VSAGAFRFGFVAIVGRPNVGKSSLLNALIGEKLSIVSAKAQTTRHAIRGVANGEGWQIAFVDTPGYQTQHGGELNRLMNRTVSQTLQEVDLSFFVVEAGRWGDADRAVLRLLPPQRPVLLVPSKVDLLADKSALLPFIERMSREFSFAEIVPVSARKGWGRDELLRCAAQRLPEGEALFPPDEFTDRSEQFLVAEFLREKLFRRLGDEVPYGATVAVEHFVVEGSLRRIHAVVFVDRDSQKAIVIGRRGEQLKQIATEARLDLERLFGGKVFLEVWVKVRAGWSDDARALKTLGYE
jgi:GTP-binding protein Era